jgi:hypothetical protein
MKRLTLITTVAAALACTAAASLSAKPKPLCVGAQPGCFAAIQQAVDAAHDGETIRVLPGRYAGGVVITTNLTLTGADNNDDNDDDGDDGADAGNNQSGRAVVSGGGPVLTIGSKTSTPTVTISNLVVTGGVATGNPQAPSCGPDVPTCGPGYADATALGGGIEAFPGSTVTIERSLITGNQSIPARSTASVKAVCPGEVPCPVDFGSGAGIDNWGAMTLEHTTVSDNHGTAVQSNGGGIASERGSTLTLRHSTVSGNSANAIAPTGRFASGGGIFGDHDTTLVIEDSTISGNRVSLANSFPHPYPKQDGAPDNATGNGAALMFVGSTLTIDGSHLDGNTVTVENPAGEASGFEGAFCGCGDSLTLTDSTVDDNHVTVHVRSTADIGLQGPSAFDSGGQVTIDDTQARGNTIDVTASDGDAGAFGTVAMFGDQAPTITITGSRISDNSVTATAPNGAATVLGAGFLNNGPLLLDDVQIKDNSGTADGLTGLAQGGGLWNGDLFVPHDTPPPVTLQHTRITGNTLTGSPAVSLQGGGLFTDGFPVTVTDSRIKNNNPDQCVGC